MKITITRLTEKGLENRDYRAVVKISVEDEPTLEFFDGEPEDNTLSRNFNDVYQIGDLLNKVYQAGGLDEGFELNEIEVDEI